MNFISLKPGLRRVLRGVSWSLALSVLLGVMGHPSAHAGGFENAHFGSERGHAATPTPLAVYYNPAALSATRKVHLLIDGVLALHGQRHERTDTTVPEPADGQGANLGSAKSLDVLGAPTLAGSVRLGDFALGAGLFVPFGGFVHWQGNDTYKDNTQYPGAQDGRARWHAIDASSVFLYLSAGASYLIRPARLSIGAGVNAIYGTANLVRAQTAARDDDLSAEGRSLIDMSGWMASFSVGLMWEAIADKLWIGASYQAPPGLYGGMTLGGNLRTRTGGVSSEIAADLHQKFPDIVRWAIRYKPSQRYELRLVGDYQRWSVLDRQCLTGEGDACHVAEDGSAPAGSGLISNQQMDFKDTFGVRLGASYWFSDAWETFFALGYDSNAIPGRTLSPLVLDGNDISATLGARVSLSSRFALLFAWKHVQSLPRDVKSKLDEPLPPTRLPTATGEYKQWVSMLDVMLEVMFD
jgi:long-chain fatty acid transport protein